MLTKAPRGTKDILPDAAKRWQYVEKKIRDICAVYGYEEIRTPVFEHTELFSRAIGENTDVVDKEMYTFADRGERSLTLRPENTASVMRAYLENKMYAQNALTKLFYVGPMFRYDRPQAGRMREFHQFGVEAVGAADPRVDAEVILLAVNFLRGLGLSGLTLAVNSVGCPKCRAVYREKLQNFFRDKLGELCADCRARFERAPMRILDCKTDGDKDFMNDAPKITDCLCGECAEHFEKLQNYLLAAGATFTIDAKLVRGLDYYTKTAFEIKYPPLGAQSAIAGGGRYDGLIAEIGGSDAKKIESGGAVGFAIGMERVLLALDLQNALPAGESATDVFVVGLGDVEKESFALLEKIRDAGIRAGTDYAGRSLKSQMKQADKTGAKFAVIVGEDEVRENSVTIKNMLTGEQEKISGEEIVDTLKKKIFEVKG